MYDIGIQLGRCLLEGVEDCGFYLGDGLLKAVRDFLIAHRYGHGESCDTVWTMHHIVLGGIVAEVGEGGADVDLDTLCHAL